MAEGHLPLVPIWKGPRVFHVFENSNLGTHSLVTRRMARKQQADVCCGAYTRRVVIDFQHSGVKAWGAKGNQIRRNFCLCNHIFLFRV